MELSSRIKIDDELEIARQMKV
jgi:hypothetical protein